ncbi:MAG: sigma-70 family RNA polymerase sigma factor [Clostridia bacterium]|nr:sigma-70 family RNA polymerase sigma factor [Clostridia bacterium]
MNPSNKKMTREELSSLLCAVREGDQHAFSSLYTQYLPLIGQLVSRLMPKFARREDAEDFRQEAALALYQAALAFRLDQDKVEFGLFAKICIGNRLIDKLRILDRYEKNELFSEDGMLAGALLAAAAEPADADPAAQLIDEETTATLIARIDGHLSPYEKRVFRLYLSGYSANEIAQAIGRDEKSVSNAVFRIRRKLKTLLTS